MKLRSQMLKMLYRPKRRSRDVPMNGFLLRKRVEKPPAILSHNGFKCCDNWLNFFKDRHRISFKCISREADSVGRISQRWWLCRSELKNPVPSRTARGLWTAYLQCWWKWTFFTRLGLARRAAFLEICAMEGKVKEHVSILFCYNMDGNEKIKLLVTGKYKRPLCLRTVYVPVNLEPNKSAWITKDIFSKRLLHFDDKMK